jgi:hypothetical protein
MPTLVVGIHVFLYAFKQDVDSRHKPTAVRFKFGID